LRKAEIDSLFKTLKNSKGAVVFDLDNTVYPKSLFDLGAYREVARVIWPEAQERLLESIAQDFLRYAQEQGLHYPHLFNDLLLKFPDRSATVADCVAAYHAHTGYLMKQENSLVQRITRLRNWGVPVGIATNGRQSTQITKINRLKLSMAVDAIYIGDPLTASTPPKPHMAAAQNIISEFGNISYVVGDDPSVDGAFARLCRANFIHFVYNEE